LPADLEGGNNTLLLVMRDLVLGGGDAVKARPSPREKGEGRALEMVSEEVMVDCIGRDGPKNNETK
jgi:hypothetical protein